MKATDATLKARVRHHEALTRLAGSLGSKETNGLKLWRQLRIAERLAHRLGLQLCNGPELSEDEQEAIKIKVHGKVDKILGGIPPGFFINLDPRGYALKLEPGSVPIPLYEDWGRYQILAPEINNY